MSKFEAELRRRLASDEDIEETANWFIDCMITSKMEWKDLSVFEVRFVKRIHEGYTRWMANRKLH